MRYKIIKRNDNNIKFFIEYSEYNKTTVKLCELSAINFNNNDVYYIVVDNKETIIKSINTDKLNQLNTLPLINDKCDYDNNIINGDYIKIKQKNMAKFIFDDESSNESIIKGCEKVNNCLILIKHKLNNYEFNTLRLVDVNINDIDVVQFLCHRFKQIKINYIDNNIIEIYNDATFYYAPEDSHLKKLSDGVNFDFLNANSCECDWLQTYDFIELHESLQITSGRC